MDTYADMLDLKDIVERLAELREMASDPDTELDEDEAAELAQLEDVAEAFRTDIGAELEEYAKDAPTLIRASYFVEYCQELADDLGYTSSDNPLICYIDWEAWAQDCAYDYSTVHFGGTKWMVRSV